MKAYFIPKDEAGKDILFKLFGENLSTFAAKYGIGEEEVEKYQQSLETWNFVYKLQLDLPNYSKAVTIFKKATLDGAGKGYANPTTFPQATIPPMPTTFKFDIMGQLQSMAKRMKAHPNYTESDGIGMGIVGKEKGKKNDPDTWQPHLTSIMVAGLVKLL